jgi:hypothetical protein
LSAPSCIARTWARVAIEAAHLFADRIDNPAVLERVAALDRAVPSARPSMSVTVDRRPLEEAPHA